MGMSMGKEYTALKPQPLTQAPPRARTPLVPPTRTLRRLRVQARYSPIIQIQRAN